MIKKKNIGLVLLLVMIAFVFTGCRTENSNGVFEPNNDEQKSLSPFPKKAQEEAEIKKYKEKIIEEIIKDGMTDLEKIRAVHDYLVKNISYDLGVERDVYTIFTEGKGVCSGYAEAFKMLLDTLGIECILVFGIAEDEYHEWNAVKLNGEWYHIDVTWDDPLVKNDLGVATSDYKDGSNISYEYFLVPTTIIEKDHKIENTVPDTNVTGSVSNWYNDWVIGIIKEEFKKQKVKEIQDSGLNWSIVSPGNTLKECNDIFESHRKAGDEKYAILYEKSVVQGIAIEGLYNMCKEYGCGYVSETQNSGYAIITVTDGVLQGAYDLGFEKVKYVTSDKEYLEVIKQMAGEDVYSYCVVYNTVNYKPKADIKYVLKNYQYSMSGAWVSSEYYFQGIRQ